MLFCQNLSNALTYSCHSVSGKKARKTDTAHDSAVVIKLFFVVTATEQNMSLS